MNTEIIYHYRDANNQKIIAGAILSGELGQEQKLDMFSCLEKGKYFIPSAVGLPEKKNKHKSGQQWYELDVYGLKTTVFNYTIPMTAEELYNSFLKHKSKWDCKRINKQSQMYKKKIKQGEQITSLNQLVSCEWVIVMGKPYCIGWVMSWQVSLALAYVNRGDAYEGIRLTNGEYYDGFSDDELRKRFGEEIQKANSEQSIRSSSEEEIFMWKQLPVQ